MVSSKTVTTNIKLGPLASNILGEARWKGQDLFPASQVFADEFEKLLIFIKGQSQLERFRRRLTATKTQRNETLQEIRVAFFFHQNNFSIVLWEPPGQGGTMGEFCIQAPDSPRIFIEVKSPGWESELSQQQLAAGRHKQEKYQHLEGRAFSPGKSVRFAVRKSYRKFLPTQPNLLVIADDLFVPLDHPLLVRPALYGTTGSGRESGCFVTNTFENLGGVGTFWVKPSDSMIDYGFNLFSNQQALPASSLPQILMNTFDTFSN